VAAGLGYVLLGAIADDAAGISGAVIGFGLISSSIVRAP
jgi:hypothetical protein